MFEKYTQSARIGIFRGRQQASLFGSPFFEVEHLLLGLLAADEPLCVRLFKSAKKLEEVRSILEAQTSRHEQAVPLSTDLPLSEPCKRVLSFAAEIASQLNHSCIAPEHLLVGIARQNDEKAARILFANGITLTELEQHARLIKGMAAAAAAAASPASLPDFQPDVARQVTAPPSRSVPDLVHEARGDAVPPLIGRRRELERVLAIFSRRTKCNVVLIGEPGIGKEAIVYGLAQLIADENVPAVLIRQRILRVDAPDLANALASSWRVSQSVNDAVYDSSAILYVRGLFDCREAIPGLAAFLKSARRNVMTTATPQRWQLALDRNDELARTFEPVSVSAPTKEETVQIANAHKPGLEAFHGLLISEDAIQTAVTAAEHFFRSLLLHLCVLDVLDEAAAAARVKKNTRTGEGVSPDSVSGADILEVIAARTSLPIEAVRRALAQH